MSKRIIILMTIIMLLLSACLKQAPESEPPTSDGEPDNAYSTPQIQSEISPPVTKTPDIENEDIDGDTDEGVPSVKVSASLEEGYTIIAALDNEWIEKPVYAYLYTDQIVKDILVSGVYKSADDESSENEGALYIPELSAGQAIKLVDPYPYSYDTFDYFTRIAYINSSGNYEAVLLHGDKEKENPSLLLTEPGILGAVYDENYLGNEQFIISDLLSAEFRDRTLAGEFDEYVPKGLCIAGGTMGDVNGDGIQDVLMYLMTDGRRETIYMGVMPLFILTGRSDGKFSVEKKIPDALFTPYRSASYAIAGNGYIDIVYSYVGGAACQHTQVCRFSYLPDKKSWILNEFSYQPSYNYDDSDFEILPPNFVRPLPPMDDLPLEKFSGHEYYNSFPDWSYFDEVCELKIPENELFTLGVRLNETDGYYEGYIYKYYESIQQGGFIQTIRGGYSSDEGIKISANNEEGTFIINQDVWKMSEYDTDSFHLIISLPPN